ncbi:MULTISPECIES: glucose 1-dehydrogenase [unclassified Rhodococcus (in: high G+C Gram-positive bacteria)]|uniref:glucose 1-dehydrogenase n=1 Tax=unclassified Rhodococcus (in: high G+C Gram-positive bacteria) TaxID=192944 RepID=UPI00096AB717|nr:MULTISPECIES: glucose 1-dehydrogenase [unclassified Rhodococcus (in: high G+C Gram-positive bacteria)]
MRRVEGKVALVTGGARGIGAATARLLAAEGARVVVTDVDHDAGHAVAAAIDDTFTHAMFLPHDVTAEDDWAAVIEQVTDRFGRLDVLVNNAGVVSTANVEDESLERWRWLQSINLDGVFLGTKAAIAAMKVGGGGSIVNLSSIEGLIGDPALAAYNASKGGVRIFTKSTALHCAKSGYGIRVNSVHPGYIWTPMVQGVAAEGGDIEQGRATLTALHPIGRLGTAEDIAYAILYLASDESSFVTGAELVVDGGYTAQ